MPKIKLSGQVADEIYKEAIDLIPNGGRFIAATYLSNPQKPCTQKQAFERTMEQMRHMVRGGPQDYLQASTANYLQRHYGFPAADMNAYSFQAGRDGITLRPLGERGISVTGWLNRMGLANRTLSQIGDIRDYRPLDSAEMMRQLDTHNKWLADRQQILSSAKDLFNLNDQQLSEFMAKMPATRADFSGCEIRNMDFRGQNLDGVSFKNSRLENCAFSQAQGADFSGAAIERCRFENGQLSYADFSRTQQTDVRFENCQMQQTDFTDARMKQVTFSGCDLRSAIFNGIDMNKLHFEQPEPAPVHEQAQGGQPEQGQQAQTLEQGQTQAQQGPEQTPHGQNRTPIDIQVEAPTMQAQTQY